MKKECPCAHLEIIQRLKRALGHWKSTVDMLEADRDCLEIAQQLRGVEKAITNAKTALVHGHIHHCLEHAVKRHARCRRDDQ
ncbi:metal-sensing transcriptional repressor [Duganella vulcania]|uniref:metal-sensing transcriptional repressor n=1 Tax=Duganella vulcania TaxID=2692166 RepID=UPI002811A256|nr:metal-sensing transcriptional repressor [Duganella vulcania]